VLFERSFPLDSKEYFLAFELEEREYGIDIQHLVEVVFMVSLVPLPSIRKKNQNSASIAGLLNFRGTLLPVISLRNLFGLSEDLITRFSRIVILQIDNRLIGLLVDYVSGVFEWNKGIQNLQTTGSESEYEFISHVYNDGTRVVLILEIDKLLQKEEVRISEEVQGNQKALGEVHE
jgi:chemotaxis signal transduction protein